MTTSENSVGVRIPATVHQPLAGRTAEDTPHDGVVKSNRPAERTCEVTPTGMAGAASEVVAHHDAEPVGRRGQGSGSPQTGEHRDGRVDDGQHMA